MHLAVQARGPNVVTLTNQGCTRAEAAAQAGPLLPSDYNSQPPTPLTEHDNKHAYT